MNKPFLLRVIFALIAVMVCGLLSFRPIPSTTAHNDTGRYVANQADACSSPPFTEDAGLPTQVFDLIARPACITGEPRLFLLLTSLALPLGLLLFSDWNSDGSLVLALALLFSTIGFELLTNALRQSTSIVFLLGALYCRKRSLKIAASAAALLIHDSSWIFVPLVFLVGTGQSRIRWSPRMLYWAIPAGLIAGFLFQLRFIAQFGDAISLFRFYNASYEEELSAKFLLFITLPLCMIAIFRLFDRHGGLSYSEKLAFGYSSAVLVLCTLFFPTITYRFAMTAIVLQIVLAMRAKNLSLRTSVLIFASFLFHLLAYTAIAKNVMNVFNG